MILSYELETMRKKLTVVYFNALPRNSHSEIGEIQERLQEAQSNPVELKQSSLRIQVRSFTD
jgi:hypothetical protein